MARLQYGEQNGMGQSSSHHLDGSEQGQVLHGRANYFATKQAKVDFPCFSRNDLNGWLFRCQHFFEIDQTPEEMKVKLAAINLEGRGECSLHQAIQALIFTKRYGRKDDQRVT